MLQYLKTIPGMSSLANLYSSKGVAITPALSLVPASYIDLFHHLYWSKFSQIWMPTKRKKSVNKRKELEIDEVSGFVTCKYDDNSRNGDYRVYSILTQKRQK